MDTPPPRRRGRPPRPGNRCSRGHIVDGGNAVVYANGYRACRICRNEASREGYRRRRDSKEDQV